MKISEKQLIKLIAIAKTSLDHELFDDRVNKNIASLLKEIYKQQSTELKEVE